MPPEPRIDSHSRRRCLQVYSVAGAKALPAWLSEKKARAAKRDPNYARRIELVQDLGFPGACQRLKLSPDGNFLFASGTHPPRVRLHAVQAPLRQQVIPRRQLRFTYTSYFGRQQYEAHR